MKVWGHKHTLQLNKNEKKGVSPPSLLNILHCYITIIRNTHPG